MIDIEQDLNIFYLGGSGGFFFLHYLLLAKKHYCYFRDSEEVYVSLQDFYRQKLLKDSVENLIDYRCSKDFYEQMAGSSWPDYDQYLTMNLRLLSQPILTEIISMHAMEPRDIGGMETSTDWFDFKFNWIHQRQWSATGRNWKKFEVWPTNSLTLKNQEFKKYKIYFTINDVEKWQTWPGTKLLLWTDLSTQLRMNLYKNSGTFSVDYQFPINTLSAVKNQVRKLKNSSAVINNIQVHPDVVKAWDLAEIRVNLQDLFTNKLTLQDTTDQQLAFQKKWLSLHPKSLLKKSGFV